MCRVVMMAQEEHAYRQTSWVFNLLINCEFLLEKTAVVYQFRGPGSLSLDKPVSYFVPAWNTTPAAAL